MSHSMKGETADKKRKESDAADVGFAREQIEGSIVQRFEAIARRYPGRIAINDCGQRWTYEMVNRSANRIAHAIAAQTAAGEQPIPLVFGHSGAAVVAVIGVLKAKKAYCALDPSHPRGRLNQILEELQPDVVLTDAVNAAFVQELGQDRRKLIFTDRMDERLPEDNPGLSVPSGPAAIFYTSGSTGQPKGVEHSHRSILHRIWWETNKNPISPNDRISLLFSLGFGASVQDAFGALLNGASLCLYDVRAEGLDALGDWLIREQVTSFHIPIAALRQFLDSVPAATRFPAVRHFVPSGPLYRTDLDRFWLHFPGAALLSHMGASETSVVARMVVTPETQFSGDVVPVGYPVADKQVLILDEAGVPLPREHVGEIAVCSRYIANGYWRRPDLTAKAFLPDPEGGDRRLYRMGDFGRISAEGRLEYVGRRDAQIKIRGYRVEIGDVEAALRRQEVIKDAAVVARERQKGEKKLVAYIVLRPDAHPTVKEEVRASLSAALPEYMVPASLVIIRELPRTANGKLDDSKLPEPGRERPSMATPYTGPRDPLEAEIADLWASLLDLDRVGIHDNFLQLGGHSLLAMQLVSRVLHRYAVDLSPQLLLESATVAIHAAAIAATLQTDGGSDSGSDGRSIEEMLDRVESLSDEDVERLLNKETR